jgi:hypothetical protein
VSPFKVNYGFDPTFGGIPVDDQCLPLVEDRMKQIKEVHCKLKECINAAQEAMKIQFNKHVRPTPNWRVGNKVWLNSQNIPTTRPSPKLGHKWLGPFPIAAKISSSAFKLTLPSSMTRIHPVFHVSILRKHTGDSIVGRSQTRPEPIQVDGDTEWEIEGILDRRTRGRKTEYLVSWKGFSPKDDSWEPEGHLANCAKAIKEFNFKYPDAAAWHKRRRWKG